MLLITATLVVLLIPQKYEPRLIASFNTLHLGWNNSKDYDSTAEILKDFSVIGLLEVMNEEGLRELDQSLESITGVTWDYVISDEKVGRSTYKEYYAVIWNTKHARFITSRGFFTESSDEFEREPWGADFKIGKFDFTFVLLHSIFGKKKSERKAEAAMLDTVYDYYQEINGSEQDVIIAGDFNLPADDTAFDLLDSGFHFFAVPVQPTTVGKEALVSAYDNIFMDSRFTTEFSGLSGVLPFTDQEFELFRKNISDHLPVFIQVETDTEDD